jgi:predicted dehydrogenase
MAKSMVRWGILGAAVIARKNWHALRLSGNSQLVAVASRDVARARQFISECQQAEPWPMAPEAIGSYEALLNRPDIDAVYIPLPTGVRTEWAVRAAAAGKHILVEKPVGTCLADVEQIVAASRQHQVQFMDGVMFMHSGRLPALRKLLDDGQSVGHIRRIATQFSFQGNQEFLQQNIRVNSTLEPLGCLGDLGWYNIRLILWALQAMPERVSGRILQATTGDAHSAVPLEFSAELFFAGSTSASFYCSFLTENQQWASLSGTLGEVQIMDFVLPFAGQDVRFQHRRPFFRVEGCRFNMEEHTRTISIKESSNNAPDAQETQMMRTFSNLVLSGTCDDQWARWALDTQRVLDACLKSAVQGSRDVSLST